MLTVIFKEKKKKKEEKAQIIVPTHLIYRMNRNM